MTCAACAMRIEKKLNKLDGVVATVNYATEQATVHIANPALTLTDLTQAVDAIGYGASVVEEVPQGQKPKSGIARAESLRRRLTISAAFAVPVVFMSMIPALQFNRWQWVALLFSTPVVVWGGWPFHRAALLNARHGATTMDTLISVGTISAYIWSLYALVFGNAGMTGMKMSYDFALRRDRNTEHLYFEVASAVIVFLLAGRYFESKSKREAGSALRALLALGAKEATLLQPDGTEVRVLIDQIIVGSRFVIRPGEKIATDGIVEVGTSAIDSSLVTGESLPIQVGPGDALIGATINVDGRLVVRATQVGTTTALAQMGRLVEEAQTGKAPVQRLADKISAVFVPAVMGLSLLTFAFWMWRDGDARLSFTAAISVLIIACPCALGLATPTALLVGTSRGAQLGIIIKGAHVLESTRRVDTVVLDKTGTITTGKMALVSMITVEGVDQEGALRLIGAVEKASEHPIAQAIAKEAQSGPGSLPQVESFANVEGLGVEGVVDGRWVLAGRSTLLAQRGITIPATLQHALATAENYGHTAVVAAIDEVAVMVLSVADSPKATSAGAIKELIQLGLKPVLLTGDNETVAQSVAAAVGITDVIAGVLPSQKVRAIINLQRDGRVVAMVGDGVNDAAALTQADLGMSMGTGTDAAIEAADITLVNGDLRKAATAVRLSRQTLRTIKVNLFWAFAYNVAAIPLAASGYLNPLFAGAAMAFSSVFVVSNSLRLRRFQP
jgi:P-type Cu+ transporter